MDEYFPLSNIPTNSAPGRDWLTCGVCGIEFPDIYPSGRCPFEDRHESTITLYYNEDIRDEDGPINTEEDMLSNFRDFLDECEEPVMLGGIEYDYSRVWEEIDPIAYRQAALDYFEGWDEIEVPKYYYYTDQEREYIVAHIDGIDFEGE